MSGENQHDEESDDVVDRNEDKNVDDNHDDDVDGNDEDYVDSRRESLRLVSYRGEAGKREHSNDGSRRVLRPGKRDKMQVYR